MNRKYCERWLKSCLKKKVSITATTIIMFLMTGLVVNTPIFASVLIGNTDGAPITPNGSVVSSWGITIGGGITNAGSHSVHVGDASLEEGERNVIIGTHATAGVNGGSRQFIRQSVAIGGGASANEGARAFGDQSIAIGANTIAEGNSSIAIGNDDVDRTNTITTKYTNLKGEETTGTIGDAYNALTGKSLMDGGQYRDTKSKEAAVAIGVKALAGNISLALGTASSADVVNGVAIGTGATVTRDNAIAIGGGATTEKEGTKEVDVTVNGIHYTWKGGENTIAGDVVSFGKEGYERQLKHVAAGKVSKDSTDAINGSQLHGVLEHITSEPVYFYAADNSSLDKITGTTAEAKNADALAKKIVARSMSNHRLNILGGATGDLSDNNIGVNYENDSTLRVKLAKELKDLKSTEFKNDTGDVATITGNGLTITPNGNAVSNKNVSVTKDGLNNGGNVIADVGGNLAGAKTGTTAPTTNATVPNNVDSIKNNAATVGDVLNAGWNLQNNGEAKDFVKPYDTVNFVDGSGTTAVVDTAADRSTSKIKYNVNLGNGLEKDDANNKITVKADEKSLTVGADGVKAKTDNKTITTGDNGLKVVTGRIESANSGTMQVKEGDTGKIATVDSVVNAVNNAAFTLKASSTTGGTRNTNSTVEANGEAIKAGKTIEMIAGKNLDVKHDENGKITFATVENPSFSTVQVGGDQGPKFSKTSDGNIKVSGPNGADLVKITNVKDGDVNENSKDAINGSQFHKLANNIIKLAGKNGSDAATETDAQTLNQQNGIKFTVKSSDGKLLDVTAGGDTITITPKTGTITVGADGVPTATTTNGKLVTADQLVSALTEMGWKATADKDGTGTVTGTTSELIKAGETVTFKAGDNLKIKQDGKNFIYSLNTALSGLTSAEFKDDNKNKVNITPTGITITKPADTVNNQPEKTVTLNQDGLNNGGNLITNVASNLKNYNSGNKNGLVDLSNTTTTPNSNVATVGDLRNMGWVVSSDKTTGDLGTAYDDKVKNADEVKFVGTGAAVVSGKTENGVRTITVGVTVPSVEKGTIETATGNDKGKVKSKVGDENKFTTVDTVVNAINSAAWKATSGTEGSGAGAAGHTKSDAEIKAGDTVTFKAGDNLKIKQSGKEFTYSLNPELTNLSKVEVKDTAGNSVVTTPTGTTITAKDTTDPTKDITTVINAGETTVTDKDGNTSKLDGNGITITPVTPAGGTAPSPVSLTKTGLDNGGNKITNVTSGLDKIISGSAKDLVDLSKPATGEPTVKDNTAATVGDLRNMGWVVSSDKTTGDLTKAFSAQVKNANEVEFIGKNNAVVSATTDGNGKHTVTVDVTVPDVEKGTIETATGNDTGKVKSKAGDENKFTTVDTVVNAINSAAWKATSGTEGSGAAAVGHAKSDAEIKAGDTVTFKAGDNLKIKQAGKEFTYSLNPELTNLSKVEVKDATGNSVVTTPTGTTITGKDATDPTKDITTVINAGGTTVTDKDGNTTKVDGNGITITPKDTTKNPVSITKDRINAGGNTISNVAGNLPKTHSDTKDLDGTTVVTPTTLQAKPDNIKNIVNNAATVGDVLNAGWNLQNNGKAKDFVRPYDTVNFVDGLNTKAIVTTDKDGKVSNVQIDVKDLPIAYTNAAGDKVVKAADGKYYKESDLAGKVYDPETDTFKNADGTPLTTQPTEVAKDNIKTNLVNPNAAADKTATTDPSTLGNVKSGLDTIKEADNKAAAGLVNLDTPNVSANNVATVGDLRNMGWVVSASDNAYTDTVKNANKVDFKGGNGIEVTGKTTPDGTREITVAIKEGAVTNNVKVTKEDGTVIEAIRDKDGKLYEKDANGKADKTKPVVLTAKDTVENNGSGFVTGNNVATAIQDSGWNLGKAKAKDVNKAFETEAKVHDKVNPNDDVNFVDGDNTTVSMVNVNAENTDGTSKTITYIKTDIKRDINIDSITIGRKNPEKSVTLTDKGLNNGGNNITNVAGNLDGAKTGTTAPTTNHAGVDTTTPTAANYVNPHNAATVGDVLNAGWNLKNNGTAKDFVKPYDTVNFVDGINTKVTVTTDPDGTKSDVRVDVVGLPIAFADKNGNRLVQGKDPVGNPVYYRMLSDGTVDKTLIIPASDVTVTNVNPVDSKINTVGTKGGAVISGIANGAKTYDAPTDKDGKDLKLGNDGKWYPADSVLINNKYYPAGSVVSKNGNVYPAGTTLDKDGNPTTSGTTPVTEVKSVVKPKNPGKAGLINFGHSNSDTTNAATVGDLQNMGWVVSTSDTGYNDQVRNANVVDFKEGEGIKISGETLENGVRQIKVGIDKNVVATKQELAQVERLSSAGIAGVAAMANIPQINEAASNRYNIAVGVGYHKGEKALAVGISGVSDGGRVVYKASAALDSQKQTTVGLGVGYQFGKRDIEPNELDRFRAQLDLVNTQKSSLAQKLKEETHKVVELNNKVEELEKQNKMLNEKMDLILKKLGGK